LKTRGWFEGGGFKSLAGIEPVASMVLDFEAIRFEYIPNGNEPPEWFAHLFHWSGLHKAHGICGNHAAPHAPKTGANVGEKKQALRVRWRRRWRANWWRPILHEMFDGAGQLPAYFFRVANPMNAKFPGIDQLPE
ncbi:MAG: hypothetical protein ACREIC_05500, partial [Limisphaerales bacterium]